MNAIYLIADVAQAHEGSISLAHSYIEALAATGVDAVKFQMHIADAESSVFESFRVKPAFSNLSRIEYWRKMEFTPEEWIGLKKHCLDKNLDFIVSPFSIAASERSAQIGVSRLKIGSAEVGDRLFLERVTRVCKNLILSSGMSDLRELDHAVNFLRAKQCELALLQCTTAYPTSPPQWGLNVIPLFQERYEIPIGFSDHSGDIYAGLSAAALGAQLLEFHVIFDKNMPCPDAQSSLTLKQVNALVQGVQQIEGALANPINKSDKSPYDDLRFLFGKSLAVNKNLAKGHLLDLCDLESKKPAGCGIPVGQFDQVVGKRLAADLEQWEFLKPVHLL